MAQTAVHHFRSLARLLVVALLLKPPLAANAVAQGLPAGDAESAGFDPARLARAREVVQHLVASDSLPGALVMIARRGEVVSSFAEGYADLERRTPMRLDHIFRLASESKILVSAAAMSLHEPQTSLENCVAHNGSLIPIPGRDIMVQSWYQGGVSIFDWTDANNPVEIAFHDRGPSDANRMGAGGSWSVYWYNGVLVSSEISRGLDIFELLPSDALSQNEIDAAKSVHFDHLNSQGQPQIVWPHTFALARAYVDQLERSRAVSSAWVTEVRAGLTAAEATSGSARQSALTGMASQIRGQAGQSGDAAKVRMLADALRGLAGS